MQLEIGEIYEGKVSGITKFGAFVEIDEKTTGLVHISEVANTFVNEIKDHIKEGETVKVKVLTVGDDGKISLSIKKAMPQEARPQRKPFNNEKRGNFGGNNGGNGGGNRSEGGFKPKSFPPKSFPPKSNDNGGQKPANARPPQQNWNATPVAAGPASFEDMLSKFKQNSEEKMGDIKRNLDGKRKGTSRRGRP